MGLYDVITTELKYVNQADPRVEVSFRLPYSDWLLLEKSDGWCQVEKILEELRSRREQPGQSAAHIF